MKAAAAVVLAICAQTCVAAEELVTTARYANGDVVPYVLNYNKLPPAYLIILFPGGSGVVDPRMEGGRLVYGFRGNFLLRARTHFVDDEFATVTTNSTQSEERIQAVLDDLKRRFPGAKIYLAGTSNGTGPSMALAGYLSDKIAGEIHTSSLNRIYDFDARKYKNRHLVVHHRKDGCFATTFNSAQASHERFGNDFIAMEGGISTGEPCEALSHHGYNGIERETAEAIKKWIKQGG